MEMIVALLIVVGLGLGLHAWLWDALNRGAEEEDLFGPSRRWTDKGYDRSRRK